MKVSKMRIECDDHSEMAPNAAALHEIYASEEFRAEMARILNVKPGRLQRAIEALLEANVIPRSGDAAVARAKDAAFLIAACSAPTDDIVSAATKVITMPFEADNGKEASADRRGARTTAEPSEKDQFGTQLAAVLRRVGGRAGDPDLSQGPRQGTGVTIGWIGGAHTMGGMHFDLPGGDVSFLYADRPVFKDLHPGVTLTRLNFGYDDRLDVPPDALRRFGRLMRDVADLRPDESAAVDPEYASMMMRAAMKREGWGIFDAGNGRQMIQKLDAPVVQRFETDQEAVDHVRSMAALVSPGHVWALGLHYTEVHLDDDRHSPRPQPGREMPLPA